MTAAFKEYTSENAEKAEARIGASKAGKGERGTFQSPSAQERKEEGAGTDTMKNLKKPARLPRKAPSNQTGGTAWGKKMAAEISRMAQAADMKKLILLNFPYIIAFYMVEKRVALPSVQWRFRSGQADGSFYELWPGLQKYLAQFSPVRPNGGAGRRSCAESSDLLQREEREEVSARRGIWLCPVGQPEGHRTFYRPGIREQRHPHTDRTADDEW